jgi:hypothetical protein
MPACRPKTLSALFLGFAALALPVKANAEDINPVGTYSNLRYVEEAGDLIGEELTIIPQPGGKFSILVQCDAGTLGPSVFVPAVVKNNLVTFDVPKQTNCPGHFVGRLTTKKVARGVETWLSFSSPMTDSDSGAARLKAKHSYWDSD